MDSIIKHAVKDLESAVIITCDNKSKTRYFATSVFGRIYYYDVIIILHCRVRVGITEAPMYLVIGPTITLKCLKSDKYLDFSVIPPGVGFPSGSNIQSIQVPRHPMHGKRFTQEQLLALPLARFTKGNEIAFAEIANSLERMYKVKIVAKSDSVNQLFCF